jgi:flavin reductase (DIM6/NTAB) family NADH-FMN oxidoreductase RutF/rubredoxin
VNKKAFYKITYGLYIVCSRDGNNINGHISNTVFQITADPPKFAVASHKDNLTTQYIQRSRLFTVSVLPQDVSLQFIGPWGFKSGRETDKFKSVNFRYGLTGVPIILDKTVAFIECEVEEMIDTGTHILFIGKVVDADILDNSAKPLTYAYYRDAIKGLSPHNSPTYLPDKAEPAPARVEVTSSRLVRYQCTVCGHIYDPAEGDPSTGIPPGTSFEDLPEDWTCPICGVGKNEYRPF